MVRRKRASHLNSKIPGRHEFQFKLLADDPVTSAIFGKSSGGLALEFPLADIADIGADHEAEQMLGIDALGATGSRKQRSENATMPAQNIFALIGIHVPKAVVVNECAAPLAATHPITRPGAAARMADRDASDPAFK